MAKGRDDHELLKQLSKPLVASSTDKLIYFIFAFLTSALPLYIYVSVKYVVFEGSALYAAVLGTIWSTYVLYNAYSVRTIVRKQTTFRNRPTITLADVDKNRDKLDEAQRKQDKSYNVDAISYSLYSTNLIFLFFVVLCTVVIFRSYDPFVNYCASIGFPSVVLYILASSMQSR
eukprot:Rmarinus@m.12914